MKTRLSLVMVTISLPLSSGTVCALASGRSTSTPVCMMGAVTMKTMSKTSMTSTSGVTLISDSVPVSRPPPADMDMARRTSF